MPYCSTVQSYSNGEYSLLWTDLCETYTTSAGLHAELLYPFSTKLTRNMPNQCEYVCTSFSTTWLLGRGHTILTSRELMWYYARSWDVRGGLTLNCTVWRAFTLLSLCLRHVELWSGHAPARLSHFCCRTHFVRRDQRVECSVLQLCGSALQLCGSVLQCAAT
jgi:hypothetical protein